MFKKSSKLSGWTKDALVACHNFVLACGVRAEGSKFKGKSSKLNGWTEDALVACQNLVGGCGVRAEVSKF